MTANDRFFQRKQPAATFKHGVLQRYPGVFATMATFKRPSKRVVYFDGYAGPGRYEDGSVGSPVLAAETAARVRRWGRNMVCLFCEKDVDYAAALSANLHEADSQFQGEVWNGDVAMWVDAALAEAGGDPMFTFLDPFGTGLDYGTFTSKLLGRPANQPTEVLLNYSLTSVWRIGGLLTGDEREAGSEASLGTLDAFFGGDWWRETFREARATGDEGSASAAAVTVANTLMRRVEAATGFKAFPVPVRRRPGHRPLFLLTLFYRHPWAPWLFNQQVSMANVEWRNSCMREDLDKELERVSCQPEGLFDMTEATQESWEKEWSNQEKRLAVEWEDTIAINLTQLLARTPAVPLAANVEAVYGSTLSLARDKHVNRAWDRLTRQGIACPRPKGVDLEKTTITRA